MALSSNIAGSAGYKQEGTFGTYAAPDHWVPVDSAAAQLKPTRVQATGLAAGRAVSLATEYIETDRHAEGTLQGSVRYSRMGPLINGILGGTPTIVQQGGSAAWLQTHSHTASIINKSATYQVAVAEYSTGTIDPFTMLGGMINSAQFTCETGGLLQYNFGLIGKDLTEAQSLSAPSFSATALTPFVFGNLTVKIGASFGAEAAVQGVTKVDVTIPRPLNTPIYAGATTMTAPETNDFVVPTGSLTSDMFLKATLNDRFAANTTFSMVWEWVGPVAIASTFFPTFRLKFPACKLLGDTPTLAGPDVTAGDWPFEIKNDGTNAPIICEYMTTDATVL